MKIRKVVRRTGGTGGTVMNAVVAANIGESDEGGVSPRERDEGAVSRSRQDVLIVQRNGRSEVRERDSDYAGS